MDGTRRGAVSAIMVVDDDAEVREMLALHFRAAGHAAVTAGSGTLAVEMARRARPDVVLVDILMPGMDGIETLRQLLPLLPGAGFIMISGANDRSLAERALEMGALDYVGKPFAFDYLDRIVQLHIATSR
jgi:DNA-binding response OmpR family regulator